MAPGRLLDRNVRPRLGQDYEKDEERESIGSDGDESEEEEEEEEEEEDDDASDAGDKSSLSENEDSRKQVEADVEDLDEDAVQHQISNVSFGALKQAQDALSKKRKRGSDTTADQEQMLELVRARLQQIREQNVAPLKTKREKRKETTQSQTVAKAPAVDDDVGSDEDEDEDENAEEDSDSAPSEAGAGAASRSRTSKHAPTSQSSKYQVTRKRTVVNVPKRSTRDPRFDSLQQHPPSSTGNADKAYSFLIDYQKAEIAELKSAIKTTRDEDDKETLKRKVVSMENRIKAREAKDREQEVVRRHRREEAERVKEGKKPFYLKRKDVKERALVDKFKGMKGKEREKVVERRRRKEGQREKKRMPQARRVAG